MLAASGLCKGFMQGRAHVAVLRDLSLAVAAGERIAITGRSGSGKSTLLHLLGGLDEPDAGAVRIMGAALSGASADARARLRNKHMGFVYQLHHLLPEFSAWENVAMPLLLRGSSRADACLEAHAMLEAVGLANRVEHRPSALSGGERQRVAVARALVGRPAVVLADEPTGNLDQANASQVFRLMQQLSESFGVALVVATHDTVQLAGMHQTLRIEDGALAPWRPAGARA